MYVLSREPSAVLLENNNECRGVIRGRSSRSRAEHGEGPNNVNQECMFRCFADEWQRSKRQCERPHRAKHASLGSGNEERRKIELIEHD